MEKHHYDIKSYEELKSDPKFLEQASLEKDQETYYDVLASKYSEKVTEIIDFEGEYDTDYRLFKLYSFLDKKIR